MMEKTVLVVDDIAANRNLLGETLEPHGYEILLAPNGAMALKVAEKARPNIILMDVNMPDMDGYEACRQLKANPELAEIPVIFITANDDQDSLVQGFEAGGVDYVVKPFKEKEVLMRVATHLKIHTLTQALAAKNEELENEVALRIDAEAKANAANQAKSDFLSFISHEMRSPLNAIIGFSEELTESLDTADQVEPLEDAKSIRRSAEHLLGLINHLLDLSKIEAGMMTLDLGTFPPLALTTSLIKDLEPLAKKQANALTLSQGGWEGEIVSDAGKLKQVLMNLISNACKFTEKGRVALSIDVADPVESRPSFCIRVADSGIGMSAAQMEGLFQPYQQVASSPSRRHEGTGLGLSISRQLCRLMGGDLTVESQAGQGSTFTVTLPIKIESPEE